MFGWIKSLFGIGKEVEVQEVQAKTVAITESNQKALPQKPKPAPKKKAEPKPKQPDFNKMTKAELETWAKENIGIDVDKRRKKDFIIETIKTKLKEK
jgi:predicted RNA-binding protein with RPS1 domain